MPDIFYAYTFGFRDGDFEEIAQMIEQKFRLGLKRRNSGSMNGDYFSLISDDCHWTLHRHAAREDHGTFYEQDWDEFPILFDYDGNKPMPQFEQIKQDHDLKATLLELWIQNEDTGQTLVNEKYARP